MIHFKAHSDKQNIVLFSEKRIVILGCGIQFGKTISGVVWLKSMMHKYTDPTDNFLVCSPTYKILAQSTLPPFMELNAGDGVMDKQNYCFKINGGGTVWFRTGQNPDSPVGITNVRACLCDEAGLFSRYFWANIQARCSFKRAPIRIVTSPYSLNWLYQDFIRPYQKGDKFIRKLCDVVQATSKENPYFPADEYDERQRTMEPRRFSMIYGGKFDKADGLVYDCFALDKHVVPSKKLELGTRYYGGIDWGYTDPFVFKIRAVTPFGFHYDIFEFCKTQCTLQMMIDSVRRALASLQIDLVRTVADPSRPDYINEFCRAGISVIAADNEIRMGVDRHYELIKSGKYYVFEGTSPNTLNEYELFHYPEIKDLKPDQTQVDELPVDKDNHCMDVERYITSTCYKPSGKRNRVVTHTENEQTLKSKSPFYDSEIKKLQRPKKSNRNNWI